MLNLEAPDAFTERVLRTSSVSVIFGYMSNGSPVSSCFAATSSESHIDEVNLLAANPTACRIVANFFDDE